jgi:hypothetical protein
MDITISRDVPGSQVDTPWPVDMERYEQGLFSSDIRGDRTLQKFLADVPDVPAAEGTSSLASLAKASLLLERANSLTGQWKPNFSPQERTAFYTTFLSLSQRTEGFIQSLPDPTVIAQGGGGNSDIHIPAADTVLARSLAHVAIVKMHGIFAADHAPSKDACVASARAVLDMVRKGDTLREAFANPIMPVLWTAAGQILTQAVKVLRTTRGRESELLDVLQRSMETFGENITCPLMGVQLTRVREAMALALA